MDVDVMKTFKPRADRILVRPDKPQARKGTLLTTDSQKELATTGQVLALGNDVEDFAVGDTVQWRPYAGFDITMSGEPLKIFRIDEIDGTWKEA
jgi:co-chaperonin GroES (HSP10)